MSSMQTPCTSVSAGMSVATRHAGVRAHPVTDTALEHWLKTEVAAAYDDLNAHPGSAIPIAGVKDNIDRRRGNADAAL